MPRAASGTSISRSTSVNPGCLLSGAAEEHLFAGRAFGDLHRPSGVANASAGMPSIWRIVGMAASKVMYLSDISRIPAEPNSGCSTAFTTERIVRSRPPVSVT